MHFISTDEPKRPGPVELEQVVYGKVIITWAPSPDHDLDDRLHYLVAEHDSNTRVWRVIADRLFCNTFTTSVQPGREYHFRVYAKNDLGLSDPSESRTRGVNELRGERPVSAKSVALMCLQLNRFYKSWPCSHFSGTSRKNSIRDNARSSAFHPGPAEGPQFSGRLSALHDVCRPRRPHSTHLVVPEQHLHQLQQQLLHHKRVRRLLPVHPPSWASG